MRVLSSLIVLVCVVVCVYAQTPCFAKITAVKRADQYASWTIGSTTYQIYDLVVVNEGTCTLTRIVGYFSAGPGFISEAWNYDIPSGLITGYGTYLAVGQSFLGAGFVLANSSSPSLALDRPGCSDACNNASTAAPTTAAPTTAAPTTAAPTTTAPSTAAPTTSTPSTAAPTTTAPTTAAPTTTQGCAVTAVVVRDDYSWLDNGRNTSVYRLHITNNGPCALKDFALSFGYYPGSLLSYWNLQSTLGGYLVTGYGATLAAGASYSAAGLILAGAPDNVAADPYGSNCAC